MLVRVCECCIDKNISRRIVGRLVSLLLRLLIPPRLGLSIWLEKLALLGVHGVVVSLSELRLNAAKSMVCIHCSDTALASLTSRRAFVSVLEDLRLLEERRRRWPYE